MSVDHELQTWMADWTADGETLDPSVVLRHHVRRRTRLLTVWMTGELAVASGGLVFLVHRAITHPDSIERVAMVLLGTICAVALILAVSNWRGVWRPSAQTTAEFLQVSRERARRFRRGARMGWFVLAAEAAVFAPWVWLRAGAQWWPWLFLLAMLVAGALFLIQSARWATRETALLDDLARELTTA